MQYTAVRVAGVQQQSRAVVRAVELSTTNIVDYVEQKPLTSRVLRR